MTNKLGGTRPACCPSSEQAAQPNKTEHCVSFWRCLSTIKSETNLVCNPCVIYLASE